MRGSGRVSAERREAVLRAADELNYRPNAVAQSLVQKRSFTIGVVLSDLHNPYFVEIVDGIEEAAIGARYRALFNTGSRSAGRESVAVETLLQLRTDGLILAGTVLRTREILATAEIAPVVLVARPSRWSTVDSVTNDDRAGARLAVEHLISLGHRDIAHIDGGQGAGSATRRNGYADAMRAGGRRSRERVVPGAFTEEGGAEGVEQLFTSGSPPTAIFASNDLAAVGALAALERRGLRVPDDVSVVGYDNTSLAAMGHIELTTIDQPRRQMGASPVRLLLERLDDRRPTARHIVIQPHLVVRRTTAPPRVRHTRSGRRQR